MELKNFFTEVKLQKFPFAKIEKDSKLVGIGSCFAEKFLNFLQESQIKTEINPSGIIYNLYSIHEIISRVVSNQKFTVDEIDYVNDRYILWSHHGSFGANNPQKVIAQTNSALEKFREELLGANFFIITPSSSVVYRHLKNNRLVANCHKENNNAFQVEVLSPEENGRLLQEILQLIQSINPSCKVIFSVSPIRHYPGDLSLNSRSKANLLSAVYDVVENFSNMAVYFPAYEIVHDELRDYRFYGKDMLHLSDIAEEYIFQKFIKWAVSAECEKFIAGAIKQKKFESHLKKYTDSQ